jgi:tetratricopeptide (TPR) repeat protein
LKHLQAAAALEARNSETQYTLGIYFGQHASWVDARQCFSNSVSLRPDFAPAQSSYASALANSGDYARAAQHYREALRLDPNLSHAKTNLERLLVEHPELR